MNEREKQLIDGLFDKLQQVHRQAAQRDTQAEAYISRQLTTLPEAPYYMAQALLVQEQALANLQTRVQELEQRSQQGSGGGFLSGLFGGGDTRPSGGRFGAPAHGQPRYAQSGYGGGMGSPWGRSGGGGGFLAGAMQTALGVAGGVLVADAISDAFSGGAAEAGELVQDTAGELGHDVGYEEPIADTGGDFGADFGDDTI
jgi:hypothetical protein